MVMKVVGGGGFVCQRWQNGRFREKNPQPTSWLGVEMETLPSSLEADCQSCFCGGQEEST